MKTGPKPKHNFYALQVGEKVKLKGKAKKYPHQYINEYNKRHTEKLRVTDDGVDYYAERVS